MISCIGNNRVKEVLRLHYWDNKTFEQIGRELHICRERAKQLHDKGLRYLRFPQRLKYLAGTTWENVKVAPYPYQVHNIANTQE
jgi:hypothetical protein